VRRSPVWVPGTQRQRPGHPEHGGPLRCLGPGIDALLGPEFEFSPDGTTRLVINGNVQTMTTDGVVQVERNGATQEITVNALGKITLVR